MSWMIHGRCYDCGSSWHVQHRNDTYVPQCERCHDSFVESGLRIQAWRKGYRVPACTTKEERS